jgi:hypothetical protein
MKRFTFFVIVAMSCALFARPARAQQQQQNEPSLGAMSQQAKDKKPAKVLTEDDISSSSNAAPAQTTDATADADKDKKPATDAAEDDDRSDVDKAKDDVKKWTREEDSLKGKLATLQQKEAAETSEFRKQMYRDAYNNQQTTLGELAEKRAKAEKELSEAQAKENEEGPKPKKVKKPAEGTADQASPQEQTPQ